MQGGMTRNAEGVWMWKREHKRQAPGRNTHPGIIGGRPFYGVAASGVGNGVGLTWRLIMPFFIRPTHGYLLR